MKIQRSRVVRFNVTHDDGSHGTIDFIPVDNVPGWTHRIAIDGTLTKSWLSESHKPNAETARFFIEKHNGAITQPTVRAFLAAESK
jgi:hypothetical protein